jgi:hypothetical protein
MHEDFDNNAGVTAKFVRDRAAVAHRPRYS